jgi:hypothetical protein
VESLKNSGVAPPDDFDPALLGPRQVAGWAVPFEVWREQTFGENGLRCSETYLDDSFDGDLHDHGVRRPVMLEHTFFARERPIEAVPVGLTVTLTAHQFGLWAVAELNPGSLPDAILESARSGVLGWSIGARDVDPQAFGVNREGLPTVVRRKMRLRELSITADGAYFPETLITAVGGQSLQRQTTPLNPANFFELCDQLAAARGEDNHARIDAILTKNAARLERGKARWLTEIDQAKKQLALASAWRRQSAQIQQDARSHGRPLTRADMASQLRLCSQAATLEAEARPILESFSLLDGNDDLSSPATPSRQW